MSEYTWFSYTNRDGQRVLVRRREADGEKTRWLVVGDYAYEVHHAGSYPLVGSGEEAETGATPVQRIITDVKGRAMAGQEWTDERVSVGSIVFQFWTGATTTEPAMLWERIGFFTENALGEVKRALEITGDQSVEELKAFLDERREQPVTEPVAEPVVETKSVTELVASLEAQVAELQAKVDQSVETNGYLNNKIGQYERDVEKMNEILNEAADNNNLCDRYEDALDEVNRRCKVISLTGREKEFTAEFRVTFSFSATRGSEEDRANEMMEDIERGAEYGLSWSLYSVEED